MGVDVSWQLKKEVCRYEELQKDNMSKVIGVARAELKQLWDKCYIGKKERNNCTVYHSGKWCGWGVAIESRLCVES